MLKEVGKLIRDGGSSSQKTITNLQYVTELSKLEKVASQRG